jgi:tetratricopeptide (TPR) repeat protein
MVKPAPKVNETLEIVRRLLHKETPDEFSMARIKNDSTSLINNSADIENGYLLQAIYETLEYRPDDFKKTVKILDGLNIDILTRFNLSVCYRRLGFLDEAYDISRDNAERHPDNIQFIRQALDNSLDSCRISSFLKYYESLKKLGVNEQYLIDIESSMSDTLELAKSLNISENELAKRVDMALSVLREEKCPILHLIFDFSPSGQFSARFAVWGSIDRSIELSLRIAEKILSSFEDPLTDIFTIGCFSKHELPA